LEIARDTDILPEQENIVCLDRNERISVFEDLEFQSMLGKFSPSLFSSYPKLGSLYQRLQQTLDLPIESITVGAGSDGIIRRAFHAFLSPNDIVVALQPTYGMYEVWAKIFQADFQTINYREASGKFYFDLDELISRIACGAKICCIANPDQPTGHALDQKTLRQIATACTEHNALLLIDEAYYPFYPATAKSLVHDFDNILIIRTFSKAGGIAGLRVGYAFGVPALISALNIVRGPGEVNAAGAAIASHLLDNPHIMTNFCANAEKGRDILIRTSNDLGFFSPICHGNFQLLKCPTNIKPTDIIDELIARGFAIKDVSSHQCLKGYVRVTLDHPKIMNIFCKALSQAMESLSTQRKVI